MLSVLCVISPHCLPGHPVYPVGLLSSAIFYSVNHPLVHITQYHNLHNFYILWHSGTTKKYREILAKILSQLLLAESNYWRLPFLPLLDTTELCKCIVQTNIIKCTTVYCLTEVKVYSNLYRANQFALKLPEIKSSQIKLTDSANIQEERNMNKN